MLYFQKPFSRLPTFCHICLIWILKPDNNFQCWCTRWADIVHPLRPYMSLACTQFLLHHLKRKVWRRLGQKRKDNMSLSWGSAGSDTFWMDARLFSKLNIWKGKDNMPVSRRVTWVWHFLDWVTLIRCSSSWFLSLSPCSIYKHNHNTKREQITYS